MDKFLMISSMLICYPFTFPRRLIKLKQSIKDNICIVQKASNSYR